MTIYVHMIHTVNPLGRIRVIHIILLSRISGVGCVGITRNKVRIICLQKLIFSTHLNSFNLIS